MHARAATKFVQTANKFQSAVAVEKDGQSVNGKSIMGLMMLAAGQGSKLLICCEGADAEKAIEEIEELIAGKFNED